jgi:uncharacterized membrane protein
MVRSYASSAVLSAIVMLVFDYLYLTNVAGPIFTKQVLDIQKSPMKINMKAAGFTYLIMLIGVLTLSIPRVREDSVLKDSLIYGALLGLVMYGVFDFTNMAIFKDYKLDVAIKDTLWGVFLISVVTYVGSWASYNMKWFV